MMLKEYQVKDIFRRHSVPVPPGYLCDSADGVSDWPWGGGAAIKAQVPSGGRGKAGIVKYAATPREAKAVAGCFLGRQVGGYQVREVLVERWYQLKAELYLGVITDTSGDHGCPRVLVSSRGGMDVEELAGGEGAFAACHVDPRYGLHPFQARALVRSAGIAPELSGQLVQIMLRLYDVYWSMDAEMVEINPLGVTGSGELVALDGKLSIDNNALYRHKGYAETSGDSLESYARSAGLSYVEMGGDIGIISNGAGLTMATMDQIDLLGGRPANFMDAGQRILTNGIEEGFKILSRRGGLSSILINVFGGGVRCEVIAEKIVGYMRSRPDFSTPVVVCLQGRNAEQGREIISRSGIPLITLADSMEEAVRAVVPGGE